VCYTSPPTKTDLLLTPLAPTGAGGFLFHASLSVWTVGFLLAEKTFADAERRVAAQSRQAALSELFFAQAGGVGKFGFVGSRNGQGMLRFAVIWAGPGRLCNSGSQHCFECQQLGACICGCRILQDTFLGGFVACSDKLSISVKSERLHCRCCPVF